MCRYFIVIVIPGIIILLLLLFFLVYLIHPSYNVFCIIIIRLIWLATCHFPNRHVFPQPRLSFDSGSHGIGWNQHGGIPSVTDFRACNFVIFSSNPIRIKMEILWNIDTIHLNQCSEASEILRTSVHGWFLWMKKVGLYYDYHPLYTFRNCGFSPSVGNLMVQVYLPSSLSRNRLIKIPPTSIPNIFVKWEPKPTSKKPISNYI